MKTRIPSILWGIALLFVCTASLSATLQPGDSLPELSLPDQHGAQQAISKPAYLVLTAEREMGAMAHQVLNQFDTEGLEARGIVYISDISGMPSFVSRMFALPKMRDYSYRVLIGHEEADTAMFPRQEGRLTVMRIASGKITQIDFADSAEQLMALLLLNAEK